VRVSQQRALQEFFSARDEPDPEVLQVQGEAVKSPNPKYDGMSAFANRFSVTLLPLPPLLEHVQET
jgi:hypothetical protein